MGCCSWFSFSTPFVNFRFSVIVSRKKDEKIKDYGCRVKEWIIPIRYLICLLCLSAFTQVTLPTMHREKVICNWDNTEWGKSTVPFFSTTLRNASRLTLLSAIIDHGTVDCTRPTYLPLSFRRDWLIGFPL